LTEISEDDLFWKFLVKRDLPKYRQDYFTIQSSIQKWKNIGENKYKYRFERETMLLAVLKDLNCNVFYNKEFPQFDDMTLNTLTNLFLEADSDFEMEQYLSKARLPIHNDVSLAQICHYLYIYGYISKYLPLDNKKYLIVKNDNKIYFLSKVKINYDAVNNRRETMAQYYPKENCQKIKGKYVFVPFTGPDCTLFLENSFDVDNGFIRYKNKIYQKEFDAWKNNKYQGSMWDYLDV